MNYYEFDIYCWNLKKLLEFSEQTSKNNLPSIICVLVLVSKWFPYHNCLSGIHEINIWAVSRENVPLKDLCRCHTKRGIAGCGPANHSFGMAPNTEYKDMSGNRGISAHLSSLFPAAKGLMVGKYWCFLKIWQQLKTTHISRYRYANPANVIQYGKVFSQSGYGQITWGFQRGPLQRQESTILQSVSYPKKDWWGPAHQSFFGYDNKKDLITLLPMTQLTWNQYLWEEMSPSPHKLPIDNL